MQDEEVLSEAAKCLHYAFNENHNCPEELREHFDCEYHKKLEEEKAMRHLPKEAEVKLENGEGVEGLVTDD